ncbi:MAG: DUF2293 domain-containing protein [Planctomycetota bacterium]|nr:DUF2293 domain-containing protein [Planctomycetota bacterium]
MEETLTGIPGPRDRTVKLPNGIVLDVPKSWRLLPPGDTGLTRRVKASGPTWTVQEKKGRRTFSRGVYADGSTIERIRKELELERSTETYAKRQASSRVRRDAKQSAYVEDFQAAIVSFLNFDSRYHTLGVKLAKAVSDHATPIGSGTVARTERIPIERRAESAVIAWLRHQTTSYDHLTIPRIAGMRREVRRMLAEESRKLLDSYRRGLSINADRCPLQKALHAKKTESVTHTTRSPAPSKRNTKPS